MSAPSLDAPGKAGPSAASELSDEQIIARVRGGDAALYELIMRRYNQRLYRIMRGVLGDDAETEDALQECYLHAFTSLVQFRGEAKFATWLTRIAVHEAVRRRKRRSKTWNLTQPLDEAGDPSESLACPSLSDRPQHAIENSELRQILTESIDRLPAHLRTVFILREIEGLDTHSAAACLDVSHENVRIMLHRARSLLRENIDQRLGSEVRMMYQFGAERCDRVVRAVILAIGRGT